MAEQLYRMVFKRDAKAKEEGKNKEEAITTKKPDESNLLMANSTQKMYF
jgi:hypothetical protein